MKVKELIAELQKLDGELPVCLFYESWVDEVRHYDIETYSGKYHGPLGNKLMDTKYNGKFVALNSFGDFVDPDNYPIVE